MSVRLRGLAAAILLCSPLGAYAQNTDAPAVAGGEDALKPAMIGGTLGSAAGIGVGALLGAGTACSDEGADDYCAIMGAALGSIAGSTLGAATGAYIGARLGGDSPSFWHSLVGATGGLLTGAGAAILLNRVANGSAVIIIGFTVGQGALAGLAAARWE